MQLIRRNEVEFVLSQMWWFVLFTFLFSLVNLVFLFLVANVVTKVFERSREIIEIAKDVVELKEEIGEVKSRLPSRKRLEGVIDITTSQVPYNLQ